MKLFCFFTPSHENLFYDWLMPSARPMSFKLIIKSFLLSFAQVGFIPKKVGGKLSMKRFNIGLNAFEAIWES